MAGNPTIWFARVVTVLALLGLGRQAAAQTSTITLGMTSTTGISSTVGGWTVAFAPLNSGSCAFKVADPVTFTNATQPNCAGIEMVQTVYHNRLYLTFQGVGGGPIESAVGSAALACGGFNCTSNYSDLLFNMTITAPTGVTVSSARLDIAGSAGATGDLSKVSAGEHSAAFASGLVTDLSKNPTAVSTAFQSALNSFSVTKDLKVTGDRATPGSTLTLRSVSQMFSPAAPEPISVSLLLVGLGGLAAAKRTRRRP